MSLSQALLWFAVLVGSCISVVALILVPTLFIPVVFPLFKLFGGSATAATALAVCHFAGIPLNAYAISSVTGTLRAGGDVFLDDMTPEELSNILGTPVLPSDNTGDGFIRQALTGV